ncbi:MAG: TVP38/TMEM64 family protein, partial [Syntrophobacteraceae bacterium]
MNEKENIEARHNAGSIIAKVVLIAVVVAGLIFAAKYFDIQQIFRESLEWISRLGAMGLLIFISLYILASVLFLPGTILTLGAGVVFGVVKGSVAVSIGATLGATLAFLIGRYLARDRVAGMIAGKEKFKAVDEAVGREGWKIVLLTRLSPAFPFNLLNYAFGLTKIRLDHYFFASWLGMIPGTVMYVYIGSLA